MMPETTAGFCYSNDFHSQLEWIEVRAASTEVIAKLWCVQTTIAKVAFFPAT
jgi:hypothetical protein